MKEVRPLIKKIVFVMAIASLTSTSFAEHEPQLVTMYKESIEALGLSGTPDNKLIKKTFRRLSATEHPDRSKHPDAHNRYVKISTAYNFLTNDPVFKKTEKDIKDWLAKEEERVKAEQKKREAEERVRAEQKKREAEERARAEQKKREAEEKARAEQKKREAEEKARAEKTEREAEAEKARQEGLVWAEKASAQQEMDSQAKASAAKAAEEMAAKNREDQAWAEKAKSDFQAWSKSRQEFEHFSQRVNPGKEAEQTNYAVATRKDTDQLQQEGVCSIKYEMAKKTLGLEGSNLTKDEIKKAFRQTAKQNHPDKCKSQECKSAFLDIENARKLLMNSTGSHQKTEATDESFTDAGVIVTPNLIAEQPSETINQKKPAAEKEEVKPPRPTVANNTSTGQQARTIFGSISQVASTMTATTMTQHALNMSSFRTGRLLAGVELQDVSTGEMMASIAPSSVSTSILKPGGIYSYGQLYGFHMNQGKVDDLAGFNSRGYGLETGIFKQVDTDWSVGVMVGIQDMNTHFKGYSDSMSAKSLRVGPFASWSHDNWHLNLALTYGVTGMNSVRKDPTDGQKYKGDFKAREWATMASLGYDFHLDNLAMGLVLTPKAEVMYINSAIDGFKEKGSGNNSLKIGSQSQHTWITRTGLQVSYVMPGTEHPGEFRAGVGLQKNNSGDAKVKAGYAQQGAIQELKTSSYGNDSIYYNLGYSMAFENHQNLHFDYFGSSGNKSNSHALAVTYEMKF